MIENLIKTYLKIARKISALCQLNCYLYYTLITERASRRETTKVRERGSCMISSDIVASYHDDQKYLIFKIFWPPHICL